MKNEKLRIERKEYVSSMLNDQGIRVRRMLENWARDVCKICGKSMRKIGEEKRNEIFNAFWNMNWESERNYIRNFMKYEKKQRSNVNNESRRKGSFSLDYK
ncbi:hypothetical protein HHI36_000441 [Cryptolaemus montrouzieri]|uniref:Uncharacterized protein n=1 Tax=Cryptolaemus montrouzieri TaxID=559131 RepID=A0ABD2P5E0_9CUCU